MSDRFYQCARLASGAPLSSSTLEKKEMRDDIGTKSEKSSIRNVQRKQLR